MFQLIKFVLILGSLTTLYSKSIPKDYVNPEEGNAFLSIKDYFVF